MAAGPGPVRSREVPADPSPVPATPSRRLRTRPVAPDAVVRGICPYLETDEGWRSVAADRAHRCTAVAPAARLALGKQARLCLVAAHGSCATYVAANATAAALLGRAMPGGPTFSGDAGAIPASGEPHVAIRRWRVARTHLTILDTGRGSLDLVALARARAGVQVVLVFVVLLAVAGLVIAGTLSTDSAVARRGTTSVVAPSLDWTAITVEAAERSEASPAAPRRTSARTSAQPRRYTVRSGDTLAAIATRFGTTVKALQAANQVGDPSRLRIGQELVVP